MSCSTGLLTAAVSYLGEVAVIRTDTGFELSHREEVASTDLQILSAEEARHISLFDDRGAYRPLKTAPTLQHGWKIAVVDRQEAIDVIENIYPGRIAVFRAFKSGRLKATALRDTLNRQSGMYRVAATVSDGQLDNGVAKVCRSNGGCLRTILWKRERRGTGPSSKLPDEKYDPSIDQFAFANGLPSENTSVIPLLCQEACSLLINECRQIAKK